MGNRFNLYFTKIGTHLAKKIISPENENFTLFIFNEIQKCTVEKIIDNLKAKSSHGWKLNVC